MLTYSTLTFIYEQEKEGFVIYLILFAIYVLLGALKVWCQFIKKKIYLSGALAMLLMLTTLGCYFGSRIFPIVLLSLFINTIGAVEYFRNSFKYRYLALTGLLQPILLYFIIYIGDYDHYVFYGDPRDDKEVFKKLSDF